MILVFPGGGSARDTEVKAVLMTDYALSIRQVEAIVSKPEVSNLMMSILPEYWDAEEFVQEIEQNGALDEAYEEQAEVYSEWG